jgi:hypothetical protein
MRKHHGCKHLQDPICPVAAQDAPGRRSRASRIGGTHAYALNEATDRVLLQGIFLLGWAVTYHQRQHTSSRIKMSHRGSSLSAGRPWLRAAALCRIMP